MPVRQKMLPCRMCGTPTPAVVNINFKAVPVCEGCCGAIFIQQAQWYVKQDYSHLYKPQLTTEEQAVLDMIGTKGDGEWEICRIQTPVDGSANGFKGRLSFVKINGKKATHEATGDVPKLTLNIILSLKKAGLIREYNTSTNQHGIYTYYKKN